jgi:hypothetical protein
MISASGNERIAGMSSKASVGAPIVLHLSERTYNKACSEKKDSSREIGRHRGVISPNEE